MGLFRRGMHFGSYTVAGRPEALFTLIGEAAATAEQAGFDALSVPDHVLQNDVGGGPDSPMLEAYTILGALAVRTTSARLLALVSPVTLRNPALLAKSVTTLDVISGGRAVLGIGAGWDATEHAAYGFDFPPVAERMDQLDEALGLCRSLAKSAPRSWCPLPPRRRRSTPPLDGDIPILVGGSGEQRTLRLVARYADACNVFGDAPATVRHKFSVLDRHCEAVGTATHRDHPDGSFRRPAIRQNSKPHWRRWSSPGLTVWSSSAPSTSGPSSRSDGRSSTCCRMPPRWADPRPETGFQGDRGAEPVHSVD